MPVFSDNFGVRLLCRREGKGEEVKGGGQVCSMTIMQETGVQILSHTFN